MGWSYANIVLFGPDQERVVAAVSKRNAVVSPTWNGYTLVADEEFESHDEERMRRIGIELSQKLDCPVMIVAEFDDDVLNYDLVEGGQLTDRYNSEPDYFDFAGEHIPPRGPEGGDARRLCAALKRPEARLEVEAILRRHGTGLSAPERHAELAKALGMPSYAVGFDYTALQDGEIPDGLDDFELRFTADDLK